eukprot:g61419.t1
MVPPVTVMILTLDCVCIFASYYTTRTLRSYINMIWRSCIHGGVWVTLVIWSTELSEDLENMEIGEESDNEAKRAYQAFLVAQRHAFDLYNQIPEKIRAKQKSTTYQHGGLQGDQKLCKQKRHACRLHCFFLCYRLTQMHCFLALKESMQHFALIQSLFCCCQFEFATECLGHSQQAVTMKISAILLIILIY